MKNLLSILLFTLLLVSCSKESSDDESALQKDPKVTQSLERAIAEFSGEYAIFKTKADFVDFVKNYGGISLQRRGEINSLLQYKTMSSVLDNIYDDMQNFETREEFESVIEKNSAYLSLVKLPDGEEEVKEMPITELSIFPILNKDGVIKVEGKFYKFLTSICVESDRIEVLRTITNEKQANELGLKSSKVIDFYGSENEHSELSNRWGDEEKSLVWQQHNDKYWCKNKRKSRFEAGFRTENFSVFNPKGTGSNVWLRHNYRFALVQAWRKGIPCIWYTYRTKINWNDFRLEYDIKRGDGSLVTGIVWVDDDASDYARWIKREDRIWSYFPEWEFFDVNYVSVYSRFKTRPVSWKTADWHR